MSGRAPVDRQRIETFLRRLGEHYRGKGRLYLVGGTTIVFEGLRARTLDIDLTLEVAPADETQLGRAIGELKETFAVNLEKVPPADFIPLPAGYRDRCEFIGRFGGLEVFHFDLYSTALSKLERGTEQDFADVLALLDAEKIEWAKLESCYNEILPQFGAKSLKQDPEQFRENFEALRRLWRGEE